MNSQKLETQLREGALQKVIDLQNQGNYVRKVDFVYEAAEQLIECRRTLKYTYVFAFYLPDGSPEKNLFEWLQEELETNTEKLSEILEKPLDPSAPGLKSMHDFTQLAATRLDHLLEGVKDGLTAGAQFTPEGKEVVSRPGVTTPSSTPDNVRTPSKQPKKKGLKWFGRK